MKKLIFTLLTLTLAACNAGQGGTPAFNYDRKNACEIDYGQNGISVIVDQGKWLVKNNSQLDYGSLLTVRTEEGTYSTLGRYFSDTESIRLINSMRNSQKIYLKWQKVGDRISSGNVRTNIINTADFASRFDACLSQQ
jgi:hypothetical protein